MSNTTPIIQNGNLKNTNVNDSLISISTSRSLIDKLSDIVSVKDFGAVGDAVTDDTASFKNALASGSNYVFVPVGNYYLTDTIVIPAHTSLYGIGGPLVDNQPGSGSVLLFENTVGTCVRVGVENGPVHLTGRLEKLAVVRQGGTTSTIPSGSIGIEITNAQATVIDNVTSYGHDIGFNILGNTPDGITTWLNFCNTGRIQTSHIVIDSFPEVRVSNSRFGMNGTGDMNCTNFVSIKGGNTSNPAGGPNTIAFTNCQFNQGQNKVTNWINFNNQLANSVSDTGLIMVTNCYIETITNGIVSDSTWPIVRRLIMSNNEWNMDGAQWFVLDKSTTLQDSTFSNTVVYGNITIDCIFDHVLFSNICCDQNVSFTSENKSSTLSLSNFSCSGSITFSGEWSDLIGSNLIHGDINNTATGNVYLQDIAGLSLDNNYTISVGDNSYIVNFGSESRVAFQNDGNFVIYNSSTGKGIFAVDAETGIITANSVLQLGNYTVNDLQSMSKASGTSIGDGCTAYATNGCKPGEESGSGTGVPVFFSNGSWYSIPSGAVVVQ